MAKEKTPKIVLSVQEMTELHELGLDIQDASFMWVVKLTDYPNNGALVLNKPIVISSDSVTCPAYTLEDILLKLPQYIDGEDGYRLYIEGKTIGYKDCYSSDMLIYFYEDSLLTGAYCLLKKLLTTTAPYEFELNTLKH